MQITMRADGKQAVVRLSGRFEFSAHREFREVMDTALQNKELETVTVDLADVDYIDSSALGMLLMLREKANQAKKGLALANPRGIVKQALDIAHFERLFSIV